MIKEYTSNNWSEICRIYNSGKKFEVEASGFTGVPQPLEDDQKQISDFLLQKIYVFQSSNKVLGFIGIKEGYIGWLFVDPQHFRQGIGRALLRFTVNEYNDLIWLYVMKKHTAALDLYLSEGFRITEEIETLHGTKL